MEWQFAVTHTICQTEISAFIDGLQTHIHSKYCDHKKTACHYIFIKT